jgi:hypothetical protein
MNAEGTGEVAQTAVRTVVLILPDALLEVIICRPDQARYEPDGRFDPVASDCVRVFVENAA